MGWTTTHRSKGISHKDWFQEQFSPGGKHLEILDASVVKGTVYMAAKITSPESPDRGKVFALVCLTHWAPKSYYNFGYKDMDENMGPNEANCPERILKLLTPLPDPQDPEHLEELAAELAELDNRPVRSINDVSSEGRGWLAITDEMRRLDPDTNARRWRQRCWARIHRKKAQPVLKPGMTVRFNRTFSFGGFEEDTFFVTGETQKNQRVFRAPNGVRVRIPKYREYEYEVIEARRVAS